MDPSLSSSSRNDPPNTTTTTTTSTATTTTTTPNRRVSFSQQVLAAGSKRKRSHGGGGEQQERLLVSATETLPPDQSDELSITSAASNGGAGGGSTLAGGQQQNRRPMMNSKRIQKLELQIQLHSQRRNKRRAKVPAKHIDLSKFGDTNGKGGTGTGSDHHNKPKTKQEIRFLEASMRDNFVFSDLSVKERRLLINTFQKETVPMGTVIIRQGETGDFFYVVEEGVVLFYIGGVHPVGSCSRTESFGELALLYDAPRAATCIADTETVTLWKVDQTTFRSVVARYHDDHSNVTNLLQKVPLFQRGLNQAQLSKLGQSLTQVKFAQGERIVNKGDVGEIFYIIVSGKVKVHDIGIGDSQHVDQFLQEGDWFGERALLTREPRAANVTAVTDLITQATDRVTFEKCFGPMQNLLDHEMKKRSLKGLPIFAHITSSELDQLVYRMSVVHLAKGTHLVQKGQPHPQCLWIVRAGEMVVYDSDGKVFNLKSGDYYGDKALRQAAGTLSTHNVVCEQESVCWGLTEGDIELVIGDMQRLGATAPYVSSKPKEGIALADIRKHHVIGNGAFGQVWFVTHKEKGTRFALKMLRKRQLVDFNQAANVISEKSLLSSLNHPFILSLQGSLQDAKHLYMLLDLVPGGELFEVIHRGVRSGIDDNHASFYAACILSALGYFHQRLICYRDLKPENVLIDASGYCVLVDLGFAKIVPNKTYTLCGTPEYLAPEIVLSKGHDKAADYWALGVLIYEMLVGKSPFKNDDGNKMEMFKNIVSVKYTFPTNNSVRTFAKDLVTNLLVRSEPNRLGNLPRGHLDICDHPWFGDVNYKYLMKKWICAPWVPSVKKITPTAFHEISSNEAPENDKPLTEAEQALFADF